METIDFNKLRTVVNNPRSATRNVKLSTDCYPEYTSLLSNYVVKHNHFKEKESALHIMSMQNWLLKKTKETCAGNVAIGQIWLADLGSNYKPECSYTHPIVILEEIGNMVYVIPSTSSPQHVTNAYHPVDNPGGDKYYRKVGRNDGFASTCALILSNARAISRGRLLQHKGDLHQISNPNSLFQELKEKCFALTFPKQNVALIKANDTVAQLTQDKVQLEKDKNDLLQRISELEKEIKENKGN